MEFHEDKRSNIVRDTAGRNMPLFKRLFASCSGSVLATCLKERRVLRFVIMIIASLLISVSLSLSRPVWRCLAAKCQSTTHNAIRTVCHANKSSSSGLKT